MIAFTSAPVFSRFCCALLLLAAIGGPAHVATVFAQEKKDKAANEEADAAYKQLLAANGFFQRGHFKLAGQEYDEFIKSYKDHPQITSARYARAICHYRLGQYKPAIELIKTVLKDKDFTKQPEALVVMGYCHFAAKDYEAALKTFDELLDKHGNSPHAEVASLTKAQSLYLLDRKEKTIEQCQAFLKKYSNSQRGATAWYFLALAQHDLGQFAQASEALASLFKKYPKSGYQVDALLLAGRCFEEQDKLKEAAEKYDAMLKAAPETRHAEARYYLGAVKYKVGEHDDAIKELDAVLSKYGEHRYIDPARLQLGLTQLADRRIDDARKTLQEVVQKDESRRAMGQYGLARCDIEQQKWDDAVKRLDDLFKQKLGPSLQEDVAFDRAVCRMALEAYEEAEKQFAAFRNAYPDSPYTPDATYRHAFCLHQLNKFAESLALCEAVEKMKPQGGQAAGKDPQKSPLARAQRDARELAGENLFLLGEYDRAAKIFQAFAEKAEEKSDQRRFSLRLGQCAFFTDDYTRAIDLLKPLADDREVAQDEQLREAIFVYGDALLQTEKFPQAADALEKYVAVAKVNQDEARYKLGLAYRRDDKDDKARHWFAQVMNGPTDNPWVQRSLFEFGQLAYQQDKPNEAKPSLEKVLAIKAPDDLAAPATYLLGWIEFDAGQYPQAANRFSEVIARFPKHELVAEARFQRALSLKRVGQTEQARDAFKTYLQSHADAKQAADAKYHLAACLSKLDQPGEALKLLKPLADDKDTVSDAILYDLAWAQRLTKAVDDAEKTYRRLLAEFPKSDMATPVRAELAELIYVKDQFQEAADLLEKALADAGKDEEGLSQARYRLGWCYVKLDKPEKAAPVFSRFAEENPKDDLAASAYYQAGLAFIDIGKLTDAQQHFEQMLNRHSDHDLAAVTRLKLGETQAEMQKYDDAARTYEQFLRHHDKDKFAYLAQFGLGWAHEQRKRYDDARKWYRQVIENHNGQTAARAQFQIGETYFAQQSYEEAVRELLKVDIVYDYPTWAARALYEAGRAFEQLKDIEQARTQYSELMKKYPDESPAKLAEKRLQAIKG